MTMPALNELLDRTIEMHNHLCPRQVLGVRIGIYAGELLGLELPQSNKRLFTFVETDGCFADGVAVATGCTLGHRTMRLIDYGKVAATFIDTKTDRAVRIWPHPESRQRADDYAAERSRWHTQLEAYQLMPVTELLMATSVELNVDLKAIISRPGQRISCAVCGEEILNERERLVDGQLLCPSCVGDSYWRPGSA